MLIESRTTAWWRNRTIMFLVMFLGGAAWFAKDGWYSWPRANREWAASAMGVAPDSFTPNPEVTIAHLEKFFKDSGDRALLPDDVRTRFGEPTLSRDGEKWYVGPDAYLKVVNGRLELPPGKATHSAGNIEAQKIFAAGLAVLAVFFLVRLVRIMTTRVVLDEEGLRYNGRRIGWGQMTGLRSGDYERKGWVDLEYTDAGATRLFRLDSYHVDRFDEIVTAICERKGFSSPLNAPAAPAEAGPPTTPSA